MSTDRSLDRQDVRRWLQPFLDHTCIPLMRVKSIHFNVNSVDVTLVDGPAGDNPPARVPEWQPGDGFTDEFAQVVHVLSIPIVDYAEVKKSA